jgi:hypothetical protein
MPTPPTDPAPTDGAHGAAAGPGATTRWILWLALLQSTLLYAVVPLLLDLQPAPPTPVAWAVMGVALVDAALGLALPRVGLLPAGFAGQLVGWALAESASVIGLVIVVALGALVPGYVAMAAGTLAMVASVPRSRGG